MEPPLYRRPRRASPFARGIEAAVLFCILGFSTWLFVHFTEDPAPPIHFDALAFPGSPAADTGASAGDPATLDTAPAASSFESLDGYGFATVDEIPQRLPASTRAPQPAPTTTSPPPLSPVPSPADPTRPPAGTPMGAASGSPEPSSAPRVPLAVRALDSRERAELEESVQRGLVRFGYDPARPDPAAVAARVAADPAVLDLAATLGLKAADVHWLAYDYLSRTSPAGASPSTPSPSPYAPTPLSPRNPAPRPL